MVPAEKRKREIDFPRGGGSVLTPLEYKSAANEGKNDALFDDNGETDVKASEVEPTKRRKVKLDKARQRNNYLKTVGSDAPVISGLKYNLLKPGTLVFGQVTEVTDLDISLSLPNNLTGFIPWTHVSTPYSKILESALENADDDNSTSLHGDQIVKVGQWLRAAVMGSEKKKHISLSALPGHVNILDPSEISPGFIIQGAIKSREDKGFVIDIGIEGMSGFMRSTSGEEHEIGSIQLFEVKKVESNGRIIQLSRIVGEKKVIKDLRSIHCLLPGSVVEVTIENVGNAGFAGKVIGSVDAIADRFGCGFTIDSPVTERFSQGDVVKASITAFFPDEQQILVSTSAHLITSNDTYNPYDSLSFGSILQDAVVRSVEKNVGLVLDTGSHCPGFVHISRISDAKTTGLESESGPYKVGSTHTIRVVGHSAVDNLFIVSMEKSIIEQPFLRIGDIPIGWTSKAAVKRILPAGILIQVLDHIEGFVREDHLSDVKLNDPTKRYRVGQSVKFRVLYRDSSRRRLHLTLKKTLVNSEEKMIYNYEGANVGDITHATILHLFAKGAIVQFFGQLKGFLPIAEMSKAFVRDPKEYFRVGQVARVRLTSVSAEERAIHVSCIFGELPKKAAKTGNPQSSSLVPGSVLTGRILNIAEKGLLVQIATGVSGWVGLTDIEDDYSSNPTKRFRKNQMLKVMVLSNDSHGGHGRFALSCRASKTLDSKIKISDPDVEFSDVVNGRIYRGYVKNIADNGLYVCIGHGLDARVKINQVSDVFVKEWQKVYSVGQLVTGKVVSLDVAKKQIEFSLRASHIAAGSVEISSLKDVKLHSVLSGIVKKAEDYGAFVLLDNSANISGLVHRSELSDPGHVDNVHAVIKEGDRVRVVVKAVDLDKRRLSLSMKASLINECEDVETMFDDASESSNDDVDIKLAQSDMSEIRFSEDSASDGGANDIVHENEEGDKSPLSAFDDGDLNLEAEIVNGDAQAKESASSSKAAGGIEGITMNGGAHRQEAAALMELEREILSSPDSSESWIKLVAYHIDAMQLEKARETGQRALVAINFRKEPEKRNIWLALLNLESSYGDSESLEKVFQEACQYNEPKHMYVHLASLYASAGKQDVRLFLCALNVQEAEATFETMTRKFALSSKVWTLYSEYLLEQKRMEAARELLVRAIRVLPKRKRKNPKWQNGV